jgi:hypothetical protein
VYPFHNDNWQIWDKERDEFTKTDGRMPPEWVQKMVHKGTTPAEIKELNDYVDAQWDTAYENAFAITPFPQFITKDIHALLNLDLYTRKAADVERTWRDLPWACRTTWKDTQNDYHGLSDVHAIAIIEAFHEKIEQLLALVTDLTWLSTPRWKQSTIECGQRAAVEKFGWRIDERGAERMSAPTPGRTYVNNGKQPADRGDDGIQQEVQSKKAKKALPDHCPPYDRYDKTGVADKNRVVNLKRDYDLIPEKAHKYYQIEGACCNLEESVCVSRSRECEEELGAQSGYECCRRYASQL